MGTASNTSKITIEGKYPNPDGGSNAYVANVVTIPSGVYVSGTHKVTWTAQIHYRTKPNVNQKIQVYLCASSTPSSSDILISEHTFTVSAMQNYYCTFNVSNKQFTGTNTSFTNKSLGLRFTKTTDGSAVLNSPIDMEIAVGKLQINTVSASHSITCNVSGGGGTLTANKSSAAQGTTVTLTPTPNTGYKLNGYTVSPSSVTISNNKFTMPAQNVTVTATFSKVSYTITRAANPTAGGTVMTTAGGQAVAAATMGTSITLSQSANTGYVFKGYTTSPAVTITDSAFSMPASNITITGNYMKLSTATLNSATLEGGSTAVLTIDPEKATYSHKYRLQFENEANMDTGWVDVAAGTTSVSFTVPLNWCAEIPDATSKVGGTLTLETYEEGATTASGSTQITGLTFTVPASVVPTIGTITKSIARTIGGVTYADIGDYYTQGHCGVRTQASASGAQSATIASMTLAIAGYSGTSYNYTTASGTIDFTSALLTIAGETTITITATDSRGRTVQTTTTITVQAYTNPAGSLSAWRVDAAGDPDDMGGYGKYSLTKQYTQLGTNALTWTLALKYGSTTVGTENSPADGPANLLPSDRKNLETTKEYTAVLTLTDSFETTVITARIPSAKFIIFVKDGGDHMAFMKAVSVTTLPTGKSSTIEFSGDSQIYIGNDTLEDYIRAIVQNM